MNEGSIRYAACSEEKERPAKLLLPSSHTYTCAHITHPRQRNATGNAPIRAKKRVLATASAATLSSRSLVGGPYSVPWACAKER